MKEKTIVFIGGGNMSRALLGGMVAGGTDPKKIWVTDLDPAKLESLADQFGVRVTSDNAQACAQADVVVLAVKPQSIRQVVTDLAPILHGRHIVIVSVAAGIRAADLKRWLNGEASVVRAMPNMPALVQSGATAMYAAPGVSPAQRALAESIMRAVGVVAWVVDETQMDAVTALSGSGPAYFFLLMELMEQAGVQLGLTAETARLLTVQTAFGAAKLALESDESPGALRVRVTSPGGTTERALSVFAQADLDAIVRKALAAAATRSSELADQFGAN